MEHQMNLPINIMRQIETFAKECFLDRVILFGSRARGTNRERSDIDLAVSGGNQSRFEELLEEDELDGPPPPPPPPPEPPPAPFTCNSCS